MYTSRFHVSASDQCGHLWWVDYAGTEQEARDYLHARYPEIPTHIRVQITDLDAHPKDKGMWVHLRLKFQHGAHMKYGK